MENKRVSSPESGNILKMICALADFVELAGIRTTGGLYTAIKSSHRKLLAAKYYNNLYGADMPGFQRSLGAI